jgi:hypothetical protein
MDRVEAELGTETRFTAKATSAKETVPRWVVGVAAALAVMLVVGGTALGIWLFAGTDNRTVVDQPTPTVTAPALPATTTPQPTTTLETADTMPVPDAASGWVYDPELSGEERVALVSEWAEERNLLTGEDVLAALGEFTTKVVDAESPEVAMYTGYWGFGFLSPFPSDEAVMDAGVSYDLHREGDSRNVITGVSEYVAHGPAIAEMFASMEAGEGRRNTPYERYDPAPIGVDAFAYETDGGSGAIHHLVVVNTGEALVVIATGPASPDYPEADLTEGENLTREQVDNLVRVAVEKLLGGL